MVLHPLRSLLVLVLFLSHSAVTAAPVISVPAAWSSNTLRTAQSSLNTAFSAINTLRPQLPIITAPTPTPPTAAQRRGTLTTAPLIGSSSAISELSDNTAMSHFIHFPAAHGGQLLGLTIESAGAVGIRIGVLVDQLPATAELAFFTATGTAPVATPISGAEINQIIETNRAAGDFSTEGRTYWSPLIAGAAATILLYLPNDIDIATVHLRIPNISHLFQDPLTAQSAAFCQLDAKCYANWSDEASGVAKLSYTDRGYSYVCSGSLVNDSDATTSVPYFLTANHCISTQTAASTLETHWFYQAASCNSSSRDSRYNKLTGGAQLLYASANTDTSFLRLNKQPPSGALYLGWTTATPIINDSVTGIHHPDGDLKKISFGQFKSFQDCYSDSDRSFYCYTASSASGDYLDVDWLQGVTENGSSGSALFNDAHQIIGTLWGGNDSCYDEDGISTYGRFEVAYNVKLKQWLGDGSIKNDIKLTAPIAPSGVVATDGNYTDRVQITWNGVTDATGYEVWRNTSNNTGTAKNVATVTTVFYADSSANVGTTYYYWIKATNTVGNSAFSNYDSGYRASTTTTNTPTTLTVNGEIIFGNISPTGDADWYQVTIETAGALCVGNLAGFIAG
jgi:hypothetical protein